MDGNPSRHEKYTLRWAVYLPKGYVRFDFNLVRKLTLGVPGERLSRIAARCSWYMKGEKKRGCENSKVLILGGKGPLVCMMTGFSLLTPNCWSPDIKATIVSPGLCTRDLHDLQRQWSMKVSMGSRGRCKRGTAPTDSSSFARLRCR